LLGYLLPKCDVEVRGSRDPWTFLLERLIVTVVALLGSYIPARRAIRVEPVAALRYE
jgi:ABC-type lipoprotein release transport system permease subunit